MGVGSTQYLKRRKGRRKSRGKKAIGIISLFLVVVAIVLTIAVLQRLRSPREVVLKPETISSFIDLTDKASKDNLQLDWREIAAIYGVANKDVFNDITFERLQIISKDFFIYKNDKAVGIKEFSEVVNNLPFTAKEKDKCFSYLQGLNNNYLDSSLDKDEDKKEFIKSIEKEALNNYEKYGIFPSVTMAQAILESGWGESTLSKDHNNLFGIKADSRWSGKSVTMNTKENYNDEIVAAFREYGSKSASIEDQGKFLTENKRYTENGVFSAVNYIQQAEALERAGYSTSKDETGNLDYGDKLIKVIRNYNLMSFDTEAARRQSN